MMMLFGQVVLPDVGINLGEYMGLLITGLGTVVAVAIGGFFAFQIVRSGLAWSSFVGQYSSDFKEYISYVRETGDDGITWQEWREWYEDNGRG